MALALITAGAVIHYILFGLIGLTILVSIFLIIRTFTTSLKAGGSSYQRPTSTTSDAKIPETPDAACVHGIP